MFTTILIIGFILLGVSILGIGFATFMFAYNEESFWIGVGIVFKMIMGVGMALLLYWFIRDIIAIWV